jgi:multidrug efflux pump subunit AcrA (membrane-fusion protein)
MLLFPAAQPVSIILSFNWKATTFSVGQSSLFIGVTCNLVYKIKLKPKRFTIRVRNKDVPLSPGMGVTAEIKTGERRVIEIFISPFIKYVDESLTLR